MNISGNWPERGQPVRQRGAIGGTISRDSVTVQGFSLIGTCENEGGQLGSVKMRGGQLGPVKMGGGAIGTCENEGGELN